MRCRALGSCVLIEGENISWTSRESLQNLVSRRAPLRTGWLWWATEPTGFPGSKDGALNRPHGSFPITTISRRFRGRPPSWEIGVSRAASLARNLATHRQEALLYRDLATLRSDVPLKESLEDLYWRGPRPEFESMWRQIGAPNLLDQVPSADTD